MDSKQTFERYFKDNGEKKLNKRLAELDRQFSSLYEDSTRRLYEDNIKGKLSDERFAKMSAGYGAEQAGLSDSIQQLTTVLSEKKDKTANISRFLSLVKRNLS